MKYLFKTLLLVAFSFLFIGCQESPMTPAYSNWPVTVDTTLKSKILVVNVADRQRSDGLSEVQFTLKNRQPHSDLNALYQVRWFDSNGFWIKSITDTFMKIDLGPDEEKIFSTISTSPKASTYKISIIDYDKNKKRIPNDNLQNSN